MRQIYMLTTRLSMHSPISLLKMLTNAMAMGIQLFVDLWFFFNKLIVLKRFWVNLGSKPSLFFPFSQTSSQSRKMGPTQLNEELSAIGRNVAIFSKTFLRSSKKIRQSLQLDFFLSTNEKWQNRLKLRPMGLFWGYESIVRLDVQPTTKSNYAKLWDTFFPILRKVNFAVRVDSKQ